MYEHFTAPLLSRGAFLLRLCRSGALGLLLVFICLGIGMLGYHHFESMTWLDAFLSASMILSGMGPVAPLQTKDGKLFAGCYAVFSGLALIAMVGVALSPAIHRFFHILHLERRSP